MITKKVLFAAAVLGATGAAWASGDCPLPRADSAAMAAWQPKEALEKKLGAEGWKVRRIKVEGGCYEVYATDAAGRKVEAYYDPKSLEAAKR